MAKYPFFLDLTSPYKKETFPCLMENLEEAKKIMSKSVPVVEATNRHKNLHAGKSPS